jgi:hypothetical protein
MTGEEKVTLAKANLRSPLALAVASSRAAIYLSDFTLHTVGQSAKPRNKKAYQRSLHGVPRLLSDKI